MASDPREQELQSVFEKAHEILSEQFPHVVMVAEALYQPDSGGEMAFTQLLRWYGDSTTATGLITYASDILTRRFGDAPAGNPNPAPPLMPHLEDALVRAAGMLGEHFSCIVVVVQSEGEFEGTVERSVKAIRCSGSATTAAGLAVFSSNALRKMAVGL